MDFTKFSREHPEWVLRVSDNKQFLYQSLRIAHTGELRTVGQVDANDLEFNLDPACLQTSHTYDWNTWELHIVHHHIWGCPVLYFNISSKNGQLLSLDQVSELIRCKNPIDMPFRMIFGHEYHPILKNQVLFSIHPCATKEIMKEMAGEQFTDDRYIVLWLSLIQSAIGIDLITLNRNL